MRFDIRRQGIEMDEATRQRLERRLEFALGRVERHVMRVWIHLADESGSRGLGLRCRILVRLHQGGDILVEDHDTDLTTLLDRTVNRAGLTVRRELERRHALH
jgi:ribosome-associated translation inhibitor RaiA